MRSVLAGIYLAATPPVASALSFLSAAVAPSRKRSFWFGRQWITTVLRVAGIRVEIQGAERLAPPGPYVIIANHRSYLDSLLAFWGLPVDARFVAKKSLAY